MKLSPTFVTVLHLTLECALECAQCFHLHLRILFSIFAV